MAIKEYPIDELILEDIVAKEVRDRIIASLRTKKVSIVGGDGSSLEQAVSIIGSIHDQKRTILMLAFTVRYSGLFDPMNTTTGQIVPQFMNPANRRYVEDCVVYTITNSQGQKKEIYFRLPLSNPASVRDPGAIH